MKAAFSFEPRNPFARAAAFTLLELLTVIAIIGILAAIALPQMRSYRPDLAGQAARQLLDDVGRARQLAISQRTTVFMVFVPTNFVNDPNYTGLANFVTESPKGQRLFDKQLIGYAFVSLRSVGDQPGRSQAHYLTRWKTLPQGAFVPLEKFRFRNQVLNITTNDAFGNSVPAFKINGFSITNTVPFPSEDAISGTGGRFVPLPYIAFDDRGQLISGQNEQIPLARGYVGFSRYASNSVATSASPNVREDPPGNSTNSFNVVSIDWLTGRARIERPQLR